MDALEEALERHPRVALGHHPTPLEPLANIVAGPDKAAVWIKRDDANGLGMGGNKLRQLEYYFGAAKAQNADTILITGAVQSNFARLTAAAAARLNMACHIQLEQRVAKTTPLYLSSGNVLLDKLYGAILHEYPDGEDEAGADRQLEEIASDLAAKGAHPYVIHLGPDHPPLGALGYVRAALELADQFTAQGFTPSTIFVPSGSGNTHAGLLFGLRALGIDTPVEGICVRRDAAAQRPRLEARMNQIADLLKVPNPASPNDIRLNDIFLKPGYGQANPATTAAIKTAARREGLIVDPVYTAKTFAALLDYAAATSDNGTPLMIHTGGTPAVFAYGDTLVD